MAFFCLRCQHTRWRSSLFEWVLGVLVSPSWASHRDVVNAENAGAVFGELLFSAPPEQSNQKAVPAHPCAHGIRASLHIKRRPLLTGLRLPSLWCDLSGQLDSPSMAQASLSHTSALQGCGVCRKCMPTGMSVLEHCRSKCRGAISGQCAHAEKPHRHSASHMDVVNAGNACRQGCRY